MSKRKDLDYDDKQPLPAEHGNLRFPVEGTAPISSCMIVSLPPLPRSLLRNLFPSLDGSK
jgi:hypothetical protein